MAVIYRNRCYYIYFRPFMDKQVGIKLPGVTGKRQATEIETLLLRACRSGDYSGLDAIAREACVRMFVNQGWQLPEDLGGIERPQEELVLWRAAELFITYPEISKASARWRHEAALAHLVEILGKDTPLKTLWVPQLKEYQLKRQTEGASPGTVNRELSTLSKLYSVLIELQLVDVNPVRLVKRLSTKSGESQVYLSRQTVQAIAAQCPGWFRPLIWTAYFSGMRRGEILGLTRKRLNLAKLMLHLGPDDTKEGHWKRVPIHLELIPVLEAVLQGPALISGKVFPLRDGDGIRDLELETFKNPWERACKALQEEEQEKKVKEPKWEKPWPRFHDLRHTWRPNARRSGMHPEIEMAIMGHSQRKRSVHERYGFIGDQELLGAIDKMTFDHGETQILVASSEKGKRP